MFSGRWEESLDRDGFGRVFLDFSPDVFRILLSHLRVVRGAKPEQLIEGPMVPQARSVEFKSMIEYFQMQDFMYGTSSCTPADLETQALETTALNSSAGIVCKHGTIAGGNRSHHAVLGTAALLTAESSVATWKLSVKTLASEGWLFAGIIGNASPSEQSYSDSTSFGWSRSQVYKAGREQDQTGGWQERQQGDEAVFQLDAGAAVLRMFHRRLATTFTMDLPSAAAARQARLHINLRTRGGRLETRTASASDWRAFGGQI